MSLESEQRHEKPASKQALEIVYEVVVTQNDVAKKVAQVIRKDTRPIIKAVTKSSQRLRAFVDDGVVDLEFTEPGGLQR